MNIRIENGQTVEINKAYNILITSLKEGKAYYDRLVGQSAMPNACTNWNVFFLYYG